jgi:hypothetical protein
VEPFAVRTLEQTGTVVGESDERGVEMALLPALR